MPLPIRLTAIESSSPAPPDPPQAGHRRDSDAPSEPDARPAAEALLDPLVCQLAVNQGPTSCVQTDPGTRLADPALPLREDLQNLLSGLSRRAAWGGDRRKGSAKIELSEGAWAGATLIVHTDLRSVSVELALPPGVCARGLEERIAARLEARGFAARVTVG